MVAVSGERGRADAVGSLHVDIGSRGQEQFGRYDVSGPRRKHESSVAALLDPDLVSRMALLSWIRLSSSVHVSETSVGVCVVVEEHPYRFRVSLRCRPHERRLRPSRLRVGISPLGQQLQHDFRVP